MLLQWLLFNDLSMRVVYVSLAVVHGFSMLVNAFHDCVYDCSMLLKVFPMLDHAVSLLVSCLSMVVLYFFNAFQCF